MSERPTRKVQVGVGGATWTKEESTRRGITVPQLASELLTLGQTRWDTTRIPMEPPTEGRDTTPIEIYADDYNKLRPRMPVRMLRLGVVEYFKQHSK